jgi:putative flippase GtrA
MNRRHIFDTLLRLARYNSVQAGAYAIDLGSFMLVLMAIDAPPIVANLISKVLAGTFAFFLHHVFTFRSTGDIRREAMRYFVLLSANAPLSTGLLLVSGLCLAPVPAKLTADAAGIVLNFWLAQRIVFRHRVLGDVHW